MSLQHHDHAHTRAVGDALIFATDLAHFERDVLEASHQYAVLVDFWAEWCGPCHVLSPILQRVIPGYDGRVRLAKVQTDAEDGEDMKLAGRYACKGFPTVLMFVKGVEVARFHSVKPESFVREFIETHLAA
jgi:thioredoxin 1